jgi:hypothetical protein
MLGALLGLVLVSFISAPLIYAATIEYSGLVDIYYQCGAYVNNFGTCAGNCFGFIMAIGDTAERPPIRVYIGNTEASVNYTLYRVDDVYQPNLWVAEFWGRGSGSVRVETQLRVEAYLLVNFGVGKPMYVKALALPYFAGRRETKPWEVQLGASGNLLVCTVGKYAARGEVFYNGSWRPASVSTGWYRSVVSGNGSAVKLYWSDTPESAIKVAYVVLTAPKGPDRAFVVGTDGLPVPARFLSLMAGPGVVVEKDGVVAFAGTGYLTYGGGRIELRPDATVVVEGRRCLYVGQTSTGKPLDVEVFLDGKLAVFGRGQVEAFCIPGATKARYTYRVQYPITNVTYTVEADGNYTLPLVKMEIIVHDLYLRPVKSYIIETPPNISLTLELRDYNYKTAVTAFAGKLDIYPNPLSYLIQVLLNVLEKIKESDIQITSDLYIRNLLIDRSMPYLLIEIYIIISLIYYALLLSARKNIDEFKFRLLNKVLVVYGISIIIYSIIFVNVYLIIFILFIILYRFLQTDILDKALLNVFIFLLIALFLSAYSGMHYSYFLAWTPVLILSLYAIPFFRYFRSVKHFDTSEIIFGIIYMFLFILVLLITISSSIGDHALALVLTLLLLPTSRVVHTLHVVYSSFPLRNTKKAEDSYRIFSEKELLLKKVAELLCRLIRSRKSEDTTYLEIPPYRVELNARLAGDSAYDKFFELTVKARDLGISYSGTAVMSKTGIGWALAHLRVADMNEYPSPYHLPHSAVEDTCKKVVSPVVFFLLALAFFVVNTLAGLFLAVLLTYIFHKTVCSFRLRWQNLVTGLRIDACRGVAIRAFFLLALALFVVKTVFELLFAVSLTYIFHKILCNFRLKWRNIARLALIIAAWFLAWPYVTNITNITIDTEIATLLLLFIGYSVIPILLLIVASIVSEYRPSTAIAIALIVVAWLLTGPFIAVQLFAIVAWLLAGPDMGAIINIVDYTISSVRQMIYPGDVAALLGMWPYILLLSLLLFYTPAVHQDRRCLAS